MGTRRQRADRSQNFIGQITIACDSLLEAIQFVPVREVSVEQQVSGFQKV